MSYRLCFRRQHNGHNSAAAVLTWLAIGCLFGDVANSAKALIT
jgi:hypothetical protein